jgi:hypothetical protein
MKRFFNYDEEPEEHFFGIEGEQFFGEDDEIISAYIDKEDIISVMNMDIAESELNHNLLMQAIKVSEKSMFWKFLPEKYKVENIKSVYDKLKKVVSTEITDTLQDQTQK